MHLLPVVTAIQRLEDMAIEPAVRGVDELLDVGEVGRAENCPFPAEYNAWGYVATRRPGCNATFKGRKRVEALKPVEGEDEVEEVVRSWWSSCGLVVDAYWPGRITTLEGTLGDDSVPTFVNGQ